MAWSRYGQLLAFTDCWGTRRDESTTSTVNKSPFTGREGISTYSSYNPRGQLVSQRDAQGRETRYEYSAAGDLTATVSPDGKRSTIEYDKRGRPVSVTEGGLTRSMGYDAAGRITVLTNENGSQSTFLYDPVDRLESSVASTDGHSVTGTAPQGSLSTVKTRDVSPSGTTMRRTASRTGR